MLTLAWRIWNAAFHVEPQGIKVATVFLSRRVSWNYIDHFVVMPLGRSPYVGHAVLRDGRKFGFGLSTSARKTEKNRLHIEPSIDALNEALAQRCAAHRLRNLPAKLPKSEHDRIRFNYWSALTDATSVKDGMLRFQVLISELEHAGYESAARCLSDDLDALLVHLRYPLRHRE